MAENKLIEQIQVVAKARQRAQEAIGIRDAARLEWELQNKAILDEVSMSTEERDTAEATLRELTLEAYAQTGNKMPTPGVGVRIMMRLNYEVEKAMEWAMEHKLALRLDSSAFEKIAKIIKEHEGLLEIQHENITVPKILAELLLLYPDEEGIKRQIAYDLFEDMICPMCYRLNPQHATMDNGEGCHHCQEREDWQALKGE